MQIELDLFGNMWLHWSQGLTFPPVRIFRKRGFESSVFDWRTPVVKAAWMTNE